MAARTEPRGTALVTGAAKRIGRVLTLEAARCGYDVAIHHRSSADEAASLKGEVETLGRRAVLVAGDLAEVDAQGVVATASVLGPVTLLVNNASLFEDDRIDRIEMLSAASLDAHLAVNLRAPLLLAHAFAAALPAGSEGLIVNILDQRVLRPHPQFFSYTLAKTALWTATRMMAQGLAPRIRVNGIGPGPTLPSKHQSEQDFSAEVAAVPLARGASPKDIAAALAYLIDAASVTGQMIAVDGGQHLAWRTPDIIGP